MYADKITAAMQMAIDETKRRRIIQAAYNEKHGITPTTVRKAVMELDPSMGLSDYAAVPKVGDDEGTVEERIEALRGAMYAAAEDLDFEKAARCRDQIKALEGSDKRPPDRKRQRPRR